MKAKVLISFSDNVEKVIQQEGTVFDLTEERFEEIMAANENLIKEVEGDNVSPDFPKHTGGGYYELSNGEKVKGKDAAIIAQAGFDTSDD